MGLVRLVYDYYRWSNWSDSYDNSRFGNYMMIGDDDGVTIVSSNMYG